MKLAFLFADTRHNLHLVNWRGEQHKPNVNELEQIAREVSPSRGWQFVGALRNGALAGPEWFVPSDKEDEK